MRYLHVRIISISNLFPALVLIDLCLLHAEEGEVWSFGSGRFGVLGHGNKDLQHIPKPIGTLVTLSTFFSHLRISCLVAG